MLSIPYNDLSALKLRYFCDLKALKRHYKPAPDTPITVEMVLASNGVYDCLWLLRKLNPDWLQPLCVEFSIWNAKQVLHIFESQHPNDDRPRRCIDAAEAWLESPTQENADAAARADAAVFSVTAATAVGYAATAVGYAARAAAGSVSCAADAAGSGAAFATAVADDSDAFKEQQKAMFLQLLRKYDIG